MKLTENDVEWVVNDSGELGVRIQGRCFFLYKGHSLEYERATHDDGAPMRVRRVGKREFGETCRPLAWVMAGARLDPHGLPDGLYTEAGASTPGLCDGDPENYEWEALPPSPRPGFLARARYRGWLSRRRTTAGAAAARWRAGLAPNENPRPSYPPPRRVLTPPPPPGGTVRRECDASRKPAPCLGVTTTDDDKFVQIAPRGEYGLWALTEGGDVWTRADMTAPWLRLPRRGESPSALYQASGEPLKRPSGPPPPPEDTCPGGKINPVWPF